ncbi:MULTISPECIES: MATE family efflux transporter [Spirulina sp. CCY15215]|uniref:MATE family efflux transporter n=1 Tax=Spirulina sp. CCY15215 TaxID=2767591 RepID=UPI001951607E|nr:MATE family efflux transporter [Spirulina major]
MQNTFLSSDLWQSKLFSELRLLLNLAIPLSASQLIQASISTVDTIMMGMLGSQILAAGALGAISFYTLTFTCYGLIRSLNVFVAEAFGAKDVEKIPRIVAQGFWLAGFLCLPIMLLLWYAPTLLLWIGQKAAIVALAQIYFHAIVWSIPAILSLYIMEQVASALNIPKIVTTIMFCGAIVNGIADYGLIFGSWGLPTLGIAGVGWASTIVFWLMAIAAIAIIRYQLRDYRIFSEILHFDRQLFGEILQIGWPVSLQNAADLGLPTVTTLLMGYLGAATLSANEIAFQTNEILFLIPVGLSYALTIRVSQSSGEKKWDNIPRVVGIGVAIAILVSGLASLGLGFFPDRFIWIYLDLNDPANLETVAIARLLLPVTAVFQFVFSLNLIANGILLGLKDTRIPMFINLLSYWVIGAVSAYILGFILGRGIYGFWWGLTLGWTMATIFLGIRFYQRLLLLIKEPDTID